LILCTLIDVGTPAYGVTVTTDMEGFPDHDFGFLLSGFNFAYRVDSVMPLDGSYRELTFDYSMVQIAESGNFEPLRLCLIDADTGVLLWEGYCGPGQVVGGVAVDIGGVSALKWSFSGGGMQNQAAGYILDPYVR